MRTSTLGLLVVAFLGSGCSLYFASDDTVADDVVTDPPPDPDPDPGAGGLAMARCEDGKLMRVKVAELQADQPGHGAGELLGHCEGACRSAAYECPDGNCTFAAKALCEAASSRGELCTLEGATCSGVATTECPASTTCGLSLPGSTCTCAGGAFHCTPRSPIATVQQAMVGKWQGFVDPPSFASRYPVSLWIYPDGTYWAECDRSHCAAFFYGGDGPHPDRTMSILSVSANAGAWANVAIYFGSGPPNTGAISSLVATESRLRFTYNASWLGCGQPFFFDLTRVP